MVQKYANYPKVCYLPQKIQAFYRILFPKVSLRANPPFLSLYKSEVVIHTRFFVLFRLLSLAVTTGVSITAYTQHPLLSQLHILLHHIHEASLRSSSLPFTQQQHFQFLSSTSTLRLHLVDFTYCMKDGHSVVNLLHLSSPADLNKNSPKRLQTFQQPKGGKTMLSCSAHACIILFILYSNTSFVTLE